ncbi:hypothetical protein [Actinoplanes sp. NPDC051851]|uniref:hypothetical protein n=1 Tax=Actinoplanes sp. NPDC051851 TaxID=3154753 RepID=UPI003414100B
MSEQERNRSWLSEGFTHPDPRLADRSRDLPRDQGYELPANAQQRHQSAQMLNFLSQRDIAARRDREREQRLAASRVQNQQPSMPASYTFGAAPSPDAGMQSDAAALARQGFQAPYQSWNPGAAQAGWSTNPPARQMGNPSMPPAPQSQNQNQNQQPGQSR